MHLKSGEIKAISKVKIGDKILASDSAGNQKYSTVIFIPHKQNNIATLFTHLHTKTRDIKLTTNHIIPAGDCSGKKSLPLLYASQVNVKTETRTKSFSRRSINRFRNAFKFYVKSACACALHCNSHDSILCLALHQLSLLTFFNTHRLTFLFYLSGICRRLCSNT